jgi:Zn-dependent peptidase ImmA (M78 family)/transcriptional regulator with XRE-family HTH domain
MSAHINSGLLRIARQRKGFSQGEAAQHLAVPQVSLSRYEHSALIPGDDFIARAASVYDMPISFFRQPDQAFGAPVSVHPMWRKKHDVTMREMDRIVAEMNIRVMHLRRMLEAVEYTPQSNIPRLDPEDYGGDIERLASIVRSHWLLPSGPIDNLTAAIERAGAIVVLSSLSGASVSGVTVSVPGLLPLIILNEEQPADRLRYTLSHELGHLVIHKFPTPNMEQEANSFASALLMPKNDVTIALRSKLSLPRLAALKKEWRVSMQALLYRAQSLGLIEKEQASWLWRKFAMDRMRLREPPETDFPTEQPAVIGRMVRLHLDTFGYSTADFANLLHVHEKHLGEFYDLAAKPAVPGMRLRIVR